MVRFFFTLIFLVIGPINSFAQNPLVQNLTVFDGLPTNTIYHSYQDRDHFIWFATDNGVVKYDGTDFQSFTIDDGLASNEIIRIKQDKLGRVWFFSLFGNANYYYQDTLYSSKNSELLKKIKLPFFIRDFYEDVDSTLYLYDSRYNFCIIDSKQDVRVVSIDNEMLTSDFQLLNKTLDGEFLLWTKSSVLKLNNFKSNPELIKKFRFSDRIFSVNKNKTALYNRNEELVIFMDTNISKRININIGPQNTSSILVTKDEIIWVSTLDTGVFCIKDGKIIHHINIEKSQSVMEDTDGNIWITSMGYGIYKINSDFIKLKFYSNSNFENKTIHILNKSQNNGVWVSDRSSLFLLENNKIYANTDNTFPNHIDFIKQLKNKAVLIVDFEREMNLYKDLSLDIKKSRFTFESKNKFEGSLGGKIQLNHAETELVTISAAQMLNFNLFSGIKYLNTTSMGKRINFHYYDADDNHILNTDTNFIIKNDDFILYEPLEPFNGSIISSHINLNDSVDAICIEGKNIFLILNERNIFNLNINSKFDIKHKINNFAYDGDCLFFSNLYDVYYIKNPLAIFNDSLSRVNSINIEFNEIYDIECVGNNLYVATKGGILEIPEKYYQYEADPLLKPYIKSVHVNGNKVDITSGILHIDKNSKIEIKTSNINFSTFLPESLYMLKGYDNQWIDNEVGQVTYQNLKKGKYIFYFKSKMNGYYNSNIEELMINVKGNIFQDVILWFITVIIVSITMIIILNYKKNKTIKKAQNETLMLNLESKALRSMMNPHFIFNSLGSIQNYILKNKQNEAALYLSQFARLIRQNMNTSNSNFIYIEEEIDKLRNYMELELLRLNNTFDYDIIVDPRIETDQVLIPTMMIQLFVENAIWHGISNISQRGKIIIRFTVINQKLISVFIEDNGVGIANGDKSKHTGLNLSISLTQKRLQILSKIYRAKADLVISELYPGKSNPGTRVQLILVSIHQND